MDIPKIKYDGKLIIFSSFYQWLSYANYTVSMVRTAAVLNALGINWDYWPHVGDFHIERAINGTLARFINDPAATDILMIDTDQGWDPEDVVRVLLHDEEIVAGTYRMKNRWHEYNGVLCLRDGVPIGKMLADGTALLEAERVPAGFLRIKKAALLRFAEAYPKARVLEDEVVTTFFERIAEHDGRHESAPTMFSQDMAFSKRWRDIGGKLWIDPNLKIRHGGYVEHKGDLDAHLRGEAQFQQAVQTIQGMAGEIAART